MKYKISYINLFINLSGGHYYQIPRVLLCLHRKPYIEHAHRHRIRAPVNLKTPQTWRRRVRVEEKTI